MAFLDNSGDIILDAVLTDTGRMRLARGDGSFRIAKFALSDDEIDYGLYRGSSHPDGAHPSGSAYYDLEIMQTPILEAFTNNTSLMKHKLISMPQTNLLYLPVIKLSNVGEDANAHSPVLFGENSAISPLTNTDATQGVFLLAADKTTRTNLLNTKSGEDLVYASANIISGVTDGRTGSFIRVDQGLDTPERSPAETLSPELRETQYILRVDDRLLKVTPKNSSTMARNSFIDDDRIASYYFSKNTDSNYITDLGAANASDSSSVAQTDNVIQGPRGSVFEFSLLSSTDIGTSDHLFKTLGGGTTFTAVDTKTYYFIDTSIRVSGATTGSSIDIPVRIMKYYE